MKRGERVFITGYGIITSIGKNAEENLKSLIGQRHGYGHIDFLNTAHRGDLRCCEIKLADEELRTLGSAQGNSLTRTTLLGLVAMREAIARAGLSSDDLRKSGLLSST